MKDKNGSTYHIRRVDYTNFASISHSLACAYATDFWAGTWQELLAVRDHTGKVTKQFGTYDETGYIYSDTRALATGYGVDLTQPDWPLTLWQMACDHQLGDVEHYWSLDEAMVELAHYIRPTNQGGYGGRILILMDASEEIVGFAAHTVVPAPRMIRLAERRFPYPGLSRLLSKTWPDIDQIGVYLDFAISERLRGRGLGSQLFDARLQTMLDDGADAIMGRTIKTSPAQFFGNYIRRGMRVLYTDPHNPDKCILGTHKKEVKPR